MKTRSIVVLVLAAVVAGTVVSSFARTGSSSPLKLKIRKPSGLLVPGSNVDLTVNVGNRSSDPVDSTVQLFFSGAVSPFVTAPVSLAGREKSFVVVTLPVPADAGGEKLEVEARAGEAETRAYLRVGGSSGTGNAANGLLVYENNCMDCHNLSKFRSKTPDSLLSVMARGPGGMPTFPGLTRQDAIDLITAANQ